MLSNGTVVGRGTRLHVQHGADETLLVRFYFNKIHGKDFIKINVPGDSKTEWDEPVNDVYKERFRDRWEAYQKQQTQFGKDTLLEDSGLFTEHQINTYKAFNVFTVEQLCTVADTFISKMGPGVREDQKKARSFIAELGEQTKRAELEKELQKRDAQLVMQQDQITKLQQQVSALLSQSVSAQPEVRQKRKYTKRVKDQPTQE